VPLLSDTERAWLAAYTDGEGYMDLDSTARVVWTSTHRPTLEYIQSLVGGKFRTLSALKGQRKPRYQVFLSGERARGVLRSILPWLREKRPQADLILSYIPGTPGRRDDARMNQRAAIKARLRELRHEPS
jgi:hypothetical protein